MISNGLKLNQDKTELLLISSRYRPRAFLHSVQVGDEEILPSTSARNLGVIFDQCLSLVGHIKKLCSATQYQLSNISKIRKYLSVETTEMG